MKNKKLVLSLCSIVALVAVSITALGLTNADKLQLLLGKGESLINKSDATKQEIKDTESMAAFLVSDAKPEKSTDDTAKLAFDGKESTVWTAASADEQILQYDFDEMTVLNQVHIKEASSAKGGEARRFHIDAWNGEEWAKIYNSDIIENYKLCVVNKIKTWAIRLVIDEGTETPISISEMSATNQQPVEKTEKFRNLGYIHNYAFRGANKFQFMEGQLDCLTEVVFHHLVFWKSGTGDKKLTLKYDEKADTYAQDLIDAVGSADVDRYLGVANEADLIDDVDALTSLADEIVAYAEKFNFAGVELDYEYPYSTAAHNAYNKFLVILGDKLHAKDMKLATAVGFWNNQFNDKVIDTIDYFNIMNYDAQGYYNSWHSTFRFATDEIKTAADRNFPMEKVNLGVPFYGMGFKGGVDFNKTAVYSAFYSPEDDDESFDTGLNDMFGHYYNGPQMIRDKTAYAIQSGCGGMMIWQIMGDTDATQKYSLLRTMQNTIDEYTTVK